MYGRYIRRRFPGGHHLIVLFVLSHCSFIGSWTWRVNRRTSILLVLHWTCSRCTSMETRAALLLFCLSACMTVVYGLGAGRDTKTRSAFCRLRWETNATLATWRLAGLHVNLVLRCVTLGYQLGPRPRLTALQALRSGATTLHLGCPLLHRWTPSAVVCILSSHRWLSG